MNAEILETKRVTKLGLGMQIPKIPAQRKFVLAECHVHSTPTNRPQLWLLQS